MAEGGASVFEMLDRRRRVAGGSRLEAAGSECATGRKFGKRRRRTRHLRQALAGLVLGRYRCKQSCRVGMARRRDDIRRRTCFHDPARIHHADLVREARHHREVVCDPHERRPGLVREAPHFGKDLALDRHVERGRRLVGDDHRGFMQQRNGNGHALTHAARELMRIGIETLLGAGNTHDGERVPSATACDFARDVVVRTHRRDHLRGDLEDRVQRHHGVLEHHRDVRAPDPPQRFAFEFRQVHPIQQDFAAGDPAGQLDEPQDRIPRDTLAGARFTDETKNAAARHLEGHAVHGLHDAAPERRTRCADP